MTERTTPEAGADSPDDGREPDRSPAATHDQGAVKTPGLSERISAEDLGQISFPRSSDILETRFSDTSTRLTPRPDGGFNIEQHKAEQRAASALHRQHLEAAEADHRRKQEATRNAQRLMHERIMFFGVVGVLSGTLMVALIAALLSENDQTREWGRSIVVLVVGGIVGGLAGYITGQSSR